MRAPTEADAEMPSGADPKADPAREAILVIPTLDDGSRRVDHSVQVTSRPFVRLNVLTVQNAAALRYQTW